MRASAWVGVSPSGDRTPRPDSAWPRRPGHSNLEELVEVGGEDRVELHALEERHRVVRAELQDARLELEKRQLTVEQALERLGTDLRGHSDRLCIGSHAPGVTVR